MWMWRENLIVVKYLKHVGVSYLCTWMQNICSLQRMTAKASFRLWIYVSIDRKLRKGCMTYLIKSDFVLMRSVTDRSPPQTVWISIIIWCKCSPCEKWRDLCICTLDESARVQVSFVKPIRMNGFVSADEFSTCNPSLLAPKSLYALCVSWVRNVDTVCPPVRSKFVMENAGQMARSSSNVPEGELSARSPEIYVIVNPIGLREVRQGWNWRQNLHDIFGMRNSYSCHLIITPDVRFALYNNNKISERTFWIFCGGGDSAQLSC